MKQHAIIIKLKHWLNELQRVWRYQCTPWLQNIKILKKLSHQKILYGLLGAFFLLLAGRFAWSLLMQHFIKQAMSAPPVVSVVKVQKSMWQTPVYATGTLENHQTVSLLSQTAGLVETLYDHPGTKVQPGDVLFTIDAQTSQANLQAARAQYQLAEQNVIRARTLFQSHTIPKATLDQYEATFLSAQADVTAKQSLLNHHVVVAPAGGIAGLNQVKVGDYVKVGQLLMVLDTQNSRVVAHLPGNTPVRLNDPADVCYQQHCVVGRIAAIDAAIDITTRTLMVRINASFKEMPKPGSFVTLTLYTGPKINLYTVPAIALSSNTYGYHVFKVVPYPSSKHKPQWVVQAVVVTPGVRIHDRVAITGVTERDRVVASGIQRVSDGQLILQDEH
jgi:membrane fusion protein, multidrug efflux system